MSTDRESLCGYCGHYCGACPVNIDYKKGIEFQQKLAQALSVQLKRPVPITEIQCPGCRQAREDKDAWGHKCLIRNCALDKELDSCSHCPDFPCDKLQKITELSENTVVAQLAEFNELGMDKWLELMEERWKCPKCSGAIETFTKKCASCNKDCSKQIEDSIKNRD